jgi:hypothetical protein
MTHEQEEYAHYQDKLSGLQKVTRANRTGERHDDEYPVDKNSFAKIGRVPFVN